jgi:hypothetical protein
LLAGLVARWVLKEAPDITETPEDFDVVFLTRRPDEIKRLIKEAVASEEQ